MRTLIKFVFFLLLASSISSLISAFYLFLVLDLKILSAIFLVFFPITMYLSLNLFQKNRSVLTLKQRKLIKNIFPPFISLFFSNISNKKKRKRQELLFDGYEELFFELIKKSEIYGEYGMGQSTISAMNIKDLIVYSVDSDKAWVENVKSFSSSKHHLLYVDLGPVQDWGTPKDYSKRENIKIYLNYIWEMQEKPDLVLIDGRFRVASFLTSLRECNLGTTIIFDDYLDRPKYTIVEEFIKPNQFFGRQAIFEIKSKDNIDLYELNKLIDKFEYVTD